MLPRYGKALAKHLPKCLHKTPLSFLCFCFASSSASPSQTAAVLRFWPPNFPRLLAANFLRSLARARASLRVPACAHVALRSLAYDEPFNNHNIFALRRSEYSPSIFIFASILSLVFFCHFSFCALSLVS